MKMYSSEICPGCKNFKALMAERGIENAFEIIDITEDVRKMREFLKLRDNEAAFAAVREHSFIGIPAFVNDDGEITLDEDTALAWIGQPPMVKNFPGCATCK